MKSIEAVVGAGGVLHIDHAPFEPGTRVQITESPRDPEAMSDAEWREALLRTRGALASVDFVEPEPNYPEPIEPLFPDESPA